MASILLQHPIVIVDGGYYVFYRYYATKRWFLNRYPDADPEDPASVAELTAGFWKHLRADVGKIRATYGVPIEQKLVFCFDCPRAEIWRNALFPAYKANRKTAETFPGGIFQEVQDHLRGLADSVIVLKGDRCEADDIAAGLVRMIRGSEGGEATPIVCITNDNDYLQLCEADGRTRAINLQGVDLAERNGGAGDAAMRIKVLMGDKSDEIPPVYGGVGPKTAAKLAAMGEEELREHIAKKGGAAALERYELNRTLIDLGRTPSDILAPILEKMTLLRI